MAFLLLIPFFLIRFGLLSSANKDAVRRAAYFAPLKGSEKTAYWLYQASNIAVFIYMFFCKIKLAPKWLFCSGLAVYLLGTVLLALAILYFAKPAESGINQNGIYKLSRNPMYVAYFMFFIGCTLLVQSFILLLLVVVFQITAHWIILSEERWCIQKFGDEYCRYMKKVRRYI